MLENKFKTDNQAFLNHCEKTFLRAVDLYKITASCKGERHCTCSTTVLPLLLELSSEFCACCYQQQKHRCTCSTTITSVPVPVQRVVAAKSSSKVMTDGREGRTSNRSSSAEDDDGREPSRSPPKTPKKEKNYKGAIFTLEKDGFHICMDVKQFRYPELSVKIVDDMIVIEAKHGDREDNKGTVARSVVRKYQIPKESDPDKIEAELSSDSILTVKAPLRKENRNERAIKIKQLSDEACCQDCPCMNENDK